VLASAESVSPEDNSGSAQLHTKLWSRTGVQSRRSWDLGLGRAQSEERYRPRRDASSDDTSWSIAKCETHFSDCVHVIAEVSLLHRIVTLQYSSIVQEHFTKHGVRFGRDFALRFSQQPYFTAGIFLDSIRTNFLAYIDTLRGLAVLGQEIAILLMHNCSTHVSDNVIRIVTEARVRVITFAPDATQVFQILDLILFGVPKPCPMYELPFDGDNATAKGITKVYHDFTQTIVPVSV
jgi:hypothetical protein